MSALSYAEVAKLTTGKQPPTKRPKQQTNLQIAATDNDEAILPDGFEAMDEFEARHPLKFRLMRMLEERRKAVLGICMLRGWKLGNGDMRLFTHQTNWRSIFRNKIDGKYCINREQLKQEILKALQLSKEFSEKYEAERIVHRAMVDIDDQGEKDPNSKDFLLDHGLDVAEPTLPELKDDPAWASFCQHMQLLDRESGDYLKVVQRHKAYLSLEDFARWALPAQRVRMLTDHVANQCVQAIMHGPVLDDDESEQSDDVKEQRVMQDAAKGAHGNDNGTKIASSNANDTTDSSTTMPTQQHTKKQINVHPDATMEAKEANSTQTVQQNKAQQARAMQSDGGNTQQNNNNVKQTGQVNEKSEKQKRKKLIPSKKRFANKNKKRMRNRKQMASSGYDTDGSLDRKLVAMTKETEKNPGDEANANVNGAKATSSSTLLPSRQTTRDTDNAYSDDEKEETKYDVMDEQQRQNRANQGNDESTQICQSNIQSARLKPAIVSRFQGDEDEEEETKKDEFDEQQSKSNKTRLTRRQLIQCIDWARKCHPKMASCYRDKKGRLCTEVSHTVQTPDGRWFVVSLRFCEEESKWKIHSFCFNKRHTYRKHHSWQMLCGDAWLQQYGFHHVPWEFLADKQFVSGFDCPWLRHDGRQFNI